MSFLSSLLCSRTERSPLTEQRMMRILQTHHCMVRLRFGGVFAVDPADQEYYVCRTTDLTGMTVQRFKEALSTAFSFCVQKN